MLTKNQIVTLEITGMTTEGNGVGRHEGFAVFVPLTVVGDTAEVQLTKVLRSYAFGILHKLLIPSPDRIESDCPVFERCGGCVFRHMTYEAECAVKEGFVRDAFTRIGKLSPVFEPILPCGQVDGYRNKAQYPAGVGADGQAVCGFFAPRSHRIVPFTDCRLQPAVFAQVTDAVMAYVHERDIPPYDEAAHKGLLRHIYLRQGAHSGQMQVCLVVTKRCEREFAPLAEALMEQFDFVESVVLNINTERTNVILSSRCKTLAGSDVIADTMCGNRIRLSPLSFYQVNTVQAERLYGIVGEYAALTGGETVLDLYCGAGTIGLSLAHRAGTVIGVESVAQAVENARENAAANGIANARFICADAADAAARLRKEGVSPDVVVLDPPRKGCDEALLRTVADMRPSRIVMVSCNPATAARDCALLKGMGYTAARVRAVDMFARTGHVETVALLTKRGLI